MAVLQDQETVCGSFGFVSILTCVSDVRWSVQPFKVRAVRYCNCLICSKHWSRAQYKVCYLCARCEALGTWIGQFFLFLEKPKNRTQRWSFDKSFHTDHKETWVDKKAEDGYKIRGPTTWPSHEANVLCQFTWQYSVSMYISLEDWELSGLNLFFEVIWYLLLSFSSTSPSGWIIGCQIFVEHARLYKT